MSDIVIRFDLRFGKRVFSAALVPALMLSAVPQLGSESVTLSTYYPAPSGVYTNMITTSNTYLARDGGSLGVGTSGPSNKLHVVGNTTLQGSGAVNNVTLATSGGNVTFSGGGNGGNPAVSITPSVATVALDVAQNSTARVGRAYLSSGGDYMHLANNEYYNGGSWIATGGSGALLQFAGQQVAFYSHNGAGGHSGLMLISPGNTVSGGWGHMALGTDKADFNGHIVARAQGACTTAHVVSYATTGTTACPAGRYATMYSGVISKYVMAPRYVDVSGNSAVAWMFCCPCPSGGCPSL